jgi:23S rRNA pseudouridine2457 synthase
MYNSPEYYFFYKPFQTLCQFSPEGEKKTLADFFTGFSKNIYPVGRLDYDSEGLLLLTNDVTMNHRLLHPRFAHEREYWAQVEGIPDESALQLLRNGLFISVNGKKHKTRPAKITLMDDPAVPPRNPPIRFRKNSPASWISICLSEGKNRQVRKMTAAAGFPTLRLIRYRIGGITLDGMEPGAIRATTEAACQKLFIS